MKRPTLIVAGLIALLTLAGASGCPKGSGDGSDSGGGGSGNQTGEY